MTIYLNCQKGNSEELFVTFDYTEERVTNIKAIKGRAWNPQKRYWVIPYTQEAICEFNEIFHKEKVVIDPLIGIKELNDSISHEMLFQKLLVATEEELILKGFSPKTKKVYLGHTRRFLQEINKEYSDISVDDIRSYLVGLLDEKKKSHSYVSQALSSIRFLFYNVLHINSLNLDLPRPKKEHKLPEVLSQEEVVNILKSIHNIKHRAILFLTYSAGLRVSEVVSLTISDIDSNRKLIRIKQGKGRKDRYTLLSDTALEVLKEYATHHKLESWLFAGELPNTHLSERSVQKIFKVALLKAGIKKKIQYTR